MQFTIKSDYAKTKCNSCAHAHILKTFDDAVPVVMCRLMGMTPIQPIKECNQFLPHIHAPIPVHMVMSAWLLQPDKKDRGKMGFNPPVATPSAPLRGSDLVSDPDFYDGNQIGVGIVSEK